MGLDFAAIDFETACGDCSSICAVGLARVRNGLVVESTGILVNPECEFNYWNTAIHGITAEDVALAPTWREVWPEIKAFIGDDILAAHNAAFDMRVLRSALQGIAELFVYESVCTLLLSRSIWMGLPSYKLDALCSRYNIPLTHHNAQSDAEACAKLALELAKSAGFTSIDQMYAYEIPFGVIARSGAKKEFDEKSVTTEQVFDGLNIAFTGGLESMARSQAEKVVQRLGGHVAKSVYRGVDILVVGEVVDERQKEAQSTKLRKATLINEKDAGGILVAKEDMFLSWVCRKSTPPINREPAPRVLRDELIAFYQLVYDICTQANEHVKNHIDSKISKDEKYVSVNIYGRKSMQYTAGKTIQHVEFGERILTGYDITHEDIENIIAATGAKYLYRAQNDPEMSVWRIYVNEPADIAKHIGLVELISEALLDQATKERFGCCSFFTECSDAKECLYKGNLEYMGCYYRENLEAGRIFYGKNKNIGD